MKRRSLFDEVVPEVIPEVLPESAMLSVADSKYLYILALDLPTIPLRQMQIEKLRGQLKVEGELENSLKRRTLLKISDKANGIKTVYKNGVLYLLLPKIVMEMPATIHSTVSI